MAEKEYLGRADLLYICQLMSTEYGKYVKKVTGKDLSTNDFTTALLTKLNGIAEGAEVNVQADWNSTDSTSDAYIQNKPSIPTKTSDITNDSNFITLDDITIPTKVSDLENDTGFITAASPEFTGTPTSTTPTKGDNSTRIATTAFTVTAINDAMASITGIEFIKVDELPATGSKGYIYLVPNGKSGNNIFDEYYWDTTNSRFELFGSTAIDLTNYLKKDDVVELATTEVQAVWDSVFTS